MSLEWKFGRTRNAVGKVFHNSMEKQRTCFEFLLENSMTKERK